jgi:CPA1 family monovalent cation:H+ antiporter
MDIVVVIILATVVIVLSSIIGNFFTRIPVPLIQIVLGTAFALLLIAIYPEAEEWLMSSDFILSPELFLALFIAPLLYREAEEADAVLLLQVRKEVVFMAFALVFITVFAIGGTFHLFADTVPLAACFALGAILGPIDAVAVFALTKNSKTKSSIMGILKGEGLINDASGVVAFQFSIAALTAGHFSILNASAELILISVGGFLIGLAIGIAKRLTVRKLRELSIDNTLTYMLIELIMPFLSFLVAESFHTSGIIAAVVCGSYNSLRLTRLTHLDAEIAKTKTYVWNMLTYLLNAIVFILLGFELPGVFIALSQIEEIPLHIIIIASLVITVVLLVVRFGGVVLFTQQVAGDTWRERLRSFIFLTLSGPKGAVSLAIAFAFPVDDKFTEIRALLIFSTAIVIITTLIITSVFLPMLEKPNTEKDDEYRDKTITIKRRVIDELLRRRKDGFIVAASLYYRKTIEEIRGSVSALKVKKQFRDLKKIIFDKTIDMLSEEAREGEIAELEARVAKKIVNIQAVFAQRNFLQRLFAPFEAKHYRSMMLTKKERESVDAGKIADIFWQHIVDMVWMVRGEFPDISSSAVSQMIDYRIDLTSQALEAFYGEKFHDKLRHDFALQMMMAFYIERKEIADAEQRGEINTELADEMRVKVNEIESFTLAEKSNDALVRLVSSRTKRIQRKMRR